MIDIFKKVKENKYRALEGYCLLITNWELLQRAKKQNVDMEE